MRILSIAQKVIKELFRDKRTLALLFIAPVLILWLMNVMFSASNSTEVTLGLVQVPNSISTSLQDASHVTVKEYTTFEKAQEALDQQDVDAIITEEKDGYSILYANTDSSKTTLTRQLFKSVVGQSAIETMISDIKNAINQSPTLASVMSGKLEVADVQIDESYQYGNEDTGFFVKMLPILMGFIVFFFVFLISGMALLKERTTGTLDRLLATPVKRSDIVFGYMLSYGLLAILQTSIIVVATIWLLNLEVVGNLFYVFLINVVLALVALAFGILLSTLAKSEFQMMQFIPLVIMPQLFFSGIIPLDSLADWVQHISAILPLTYSGDALTQVILHGAGFSTIVPHLLVLTLFLFILTVANIVGLKRYRKV